MQRSPSRGPASLLGVALLMTVGCASAPVSSTAPAPLALSPRPGAGGPEIVNKIGVKISPAEHAALLQLAREANQGEGLMTIERVLFTMSFHPLDIPVAVVKMRRQIGPHRFAQLSVRCLHRKWSRTHPAWSKCLSVGARTRGPWCTSPLGIRPSEALRVNWRAEQLMIAVEGDIDLRELTSLLRRIEKRDFTGRLKAPIVAASEIWRVRKTVEGGRVTYAVYASSTAMSAAVLVLVEEQGQLYLLEGYRTIS